MKRVLQISFVLFIIVIVLEIAFNVLKKEHKIDYFVDQIQVNEHYLNGKYYFNISANENDFGFILPSSLNKAKKVLTNVIYFDGEEFECIYPIADDYELNMYCKKNGLMYSYEYVKNEKDGLNFKNKLLSMGYTNKAWTDDNDKNVYKEDNINLYLDNIEEDLNIYVWDYSGFFVIRNKTLKSMNLFLRDIYSNKLAIRLDKYYIMPNYETTYDFDKLLVYDMRNDVLNKINFDNSISYNSYYNGIVDDKIYLFDEDNLVQYEVDISKKKIKVVGDVNINAKYYDNGWISKNIYDYTKDEIKFKMFDVPSDLEQIDYSNIYVFNDIYYYLDKNNFYMYDEKNKINILLFSMKGISNIKIINNNVYFLCDNYLYKYSSFGKLNKLIKYNEFAFNKTNMYEIYE